MCGDRQFAVQVSQECLLAVVSCRVTLLTVTCAYCECVDLRPHSWWVSLIEQRNHETMIKRPFVDIARLFNIHNTIHAIKSKGDDI